LEYSCGSLFRDSIIEILEKKKVIKTLSYEDVIYLFGDTPYRILYNEGKTLKLSYDIWGGFDENLNRCIMPPAKVLELFIDTKTNTISYHGVFEE